MSILIIILAFFGGAFGAIYGAVFAFVFVGVLGLIGVVNAMVGGTYDIIGLWTFGNFFGPQIAFTGACCAAALAASTGALASGKDVGTPLISLKKPVVLLYGGVMAVVCCVICWLLGLVLTGKIDCLATGITITLLLNKFIFERTFVGEAPPEVKKAGGRYSCISPHSWQPAVSTVGEKTLLALAVGFGSSWVTMTMMQNEATVGVSQFLPYSVAAFACVAIFFIKIPLVHHIAICASYGTFASGGSLLWGVVGALLATFIADFLAETFCQFGGPRLGGVYVDQPAAGICLTSLILWSVFRPLGFYSGVATYVVPIIIIAFCIVWSFWEHARIKKLTMKLESGADLAT